MDIEVTWERRTRIIVDKIRFLVIPTDGEL